MDNRVPGELVSQGFFVVGLDHEVGAVDVGGDGFAGVGHLAADVVAVCVVAVDVAVVLDLGVDGSVHGGMFSGFRFLLVVVPSRKVDSLSGPRWRTCFHQVEKVRCAGGMLGRRFGTRCCSSRVLARADLSG